MLCVFAAEKTQGADDGPAVWRNTGGAAGRDEAAYSAGSQEKNAGTVGERNEAAGDAGSREKNAGTAGGQNEAADAAGSQEQNAGTAGGQDEAAGAAGSQEQNAGTAGGQDEAAGAAGSQEQNAGTAGGQDEAAGAAGSQEQNAGTAGGQDEAADAAGSQEQNAGTAGERNEVDVAEREEISIKRVALTFDDGPHPRYTEQLLEGLRSRNVRVTFFVLGQSAELYPDLIREMAQDGHLIGNHTYSHIQLTSGNGQLFAEELQKTDAIIYELTGQHTEFVRPPYGVWDKRYEESLNMIQVLWNVDPLDWCCSDAGTVISRVLEKADEDCIILLHDVYASSVEAALSIIDELSAQGYEFVTVDEIILD